MLNNHKEAADSTDLLATDAKPLHVGTPLAQREWIATGALPKAERPARVRSQDNIMSGTTVRLQRVQMHQSDCCAAQSQAQEEEAHDPVGRSRVCGCLPQE